MTTINLGITILGAGAKIVYSYQDLLYHWLETDGKVTADQQKRNLKTALNKHLTYNNLRWESEIGPEFSVPADQFENRLFEFGTSLVKTKANPEGLNSAYVDNLKTSLRQWHEFHEELLNSQPTGRQPTEPAFASLQEAFKFHYANYCATEKAMGHKPLSLERLSLSIGKSKNFLQGMRTGPWPRSLAKASSNEALEKLEQILDVRPRGQLTQFVYSSMYEEASGARGTRAQTLSNQEYCLTEKEIEANAAWAKEHGLTGGFSDEFTEYVKKKCAKKSTHTARAIAMAMNISEEKEAETARPEHAETLWAQVRPAVKGPKYGWIHKYISPDGGATKSATAAIHLRQCLSFFGALRGIPEKVKDPKTGEERVIIQYVKHRDQTPYSLDPLQFSMVYLCDAEMVMDVVGLLAERLNREGENETFTSTLSDMLQFCISLLNPDFGFVTERPEFGNRLPIPMSLDPYNVVDQATWKRWCRTQKVRLEAYRDAMGEPVSTRDSFAPVMKWINTQHPIDGLLELATIMQEKLNTHKFMNRLERVVMERDLTFVRMITYQPLRVLMYECLLTYDRNWNNFELSSDGTWLAKDPKAEPSTTAHLYKKLKPEVARGYVWAIRFVNDDFKNKRTKKEGNYDIEFDDNMTDAIEHYLTNIRPKLQTLIEDNHEHSDPLVFVPSVGEIDSAAAEDKELEDVVSEAEEEGISRWLSHAFRKRTRLLPGCKGFGPHNARHLVATEYIKNEPGGIEVVSAVLHDKPETVRKHYAKYLPQDIAKHYIAHVVAHIRNRNGKASPERKYK